MNEILSLIPHRHPFLWVDKINSFDGESIITEKYFPEDLDIFKGHYPGEPIMPGVLLCEAIFQSGALLMAKRGESKDSTLSGVPVLTRIGAAKFKRSVMPGDTAEIKVTLKETLSSAYFFKGIMKVSNKLAVQVEFACSIVKQ